MDQDILKLKTKLKKTFEIFDQYGNGAISIKQLQQILQALGQNFTQTQLQEIIAEIDINSDGEIDFEEFCSLSIVSIDNQSPEQDLMQVFQKFDKNGDGKISMEEAPPPMKANFSQHDSNGDGWIDAEEAKSLPTPRGQGGGPGGGGQPSQ
jgi:Ca2+-binding EF-hand superfamily protein